MTQAGILTGSEIRKQVEAGSIKITPYNEACLNPASYDLTLGSKVAVYDDVVWPDFSTGHHISTGGRNMGEEVVPGQRVSTQYNPQGYGGPYLDAAKPNPIKVCEMDPVRGFCLKPGIGYLMHTAERIWTDRYIPIIDGKSSIGRLFILIHFTAGFGDPGFDGEYTLEVMATHPVVIYPGQRIAQIRFHTTVGEISSYSTKGNYQGSDAIGPVASKSYKQMEGDNHPAMRKNPTST